jgi:NRPS condensation-like uncharacterized protein
MEYRAEAFDLMQLLYEETGFNDHQMHCVMEVEGELDEETLRTAVGLCLQAVPILGARFVERGGLHAWESLPPRDLGGAFASTADAEAFEAEKTYRVREELGPQVRICLLRGGRFALAVTMNHMVSDAAGFKAFLYFLCETYSRLRRDPAYRPARVVDGDRGLGDVLRSVGPVAKFGALFGQGGGNNREGGAAFPFEDGGEERAFIATRTMSRVKVEWLKAYCRARGATINDAAMAAYYRVLARSLGYRSARRLEIPIMVDMRRYTADKDFRSLRNLTSTVITRLRPARNESFEGTLLRVKAKMDRLKRQPIGLGGFLKMSWLFSHYGEAKALGILRRGLRHPLVCMTNIGDLDSKRLAFEGAKVESAFLCGSVKHKPHFQMALSGFDGGLTLSSNLYGSAKDRGRIEAFLREVEEELTV